MTPTTAATIRAEIDRLLADTTMTSADKEIRFNELAALTRQLNIDISQPDPDPAAYAAELKEQGFEVRGTDVRHQPCGEWVPVLGTDSHECPAADHLASEFDPTTDPGFNPANVDW